VYVWASTGTTEQQARPRSTGIARPTPSVSRGDSEGQPVRIRGRPTGWTCPRLQGVSKVGRIRRHTSGAVAYQVRRPPAQRPAIGKGPKVRPLIVQSLTGSGGKTHVQAHQMPTVEGLKGPNIKAQRAENKGVRVGVRPHYYGEIGLTRTYRADNFFLA